LGPLSSSGGALLRKLNEPHGGGGAILPLKKTGGRHLSPERIGWNAVGELGKKKEKNYSA